MLEHDSLFKGKLVRLGAEEPGVFADAFTRWRRDSEYVRLLDNEPARLWSSKKAKEWLEKDLDKEYDDTSSYLWSIRTQAEDRLIGFVGLWDIRWNHGDTMVGIGIGERDCWGKGYGTEAMRLVVGFAFRELNLRRVTLVVFDYNPRAIRSYEKSGFKVEGRLREAMNRDGQRYDMVYMGILKEEWQG
jgi:RimJ/RimL family protein N-acetyltransferase